MKEQITDFTSIYNHLNYIELTELGQDEIKDQELHEYDGKFSLDIEKENRKRVIKYLIWFFLAAAGIIIISIHLLFQNSNAQTDDPQNQGEIKVSYEEIEIYQQELPPRYHQGCIQQQNQEQSCLTCIYNTNIQQIKTQQCNSCCYSCLFGQMFVFQKYCSFEKINVFISLSSIIQNQSDLSIAGQDYKKENLPIDQLIKVLQQPLIWKHIAISFSYGSLLVSQINYFKDMLYFLSRVLNSFDDNLESLELNAGYISVKDDIYGQFFQYETYFIYEDILCILKLSKLKRFTFNMKNIDETFSEGLMILVSKLIQKCPEIEQVKIQINKNSLSNQNFTQKSIHMIQQSILGSQNLTSLYLGLPKQSNEITQEIINLILGLKQLRYFQELQLELSLQNVEQSNEILQKVSLLTQLQYLKLNINPIQISSDSQFLVELKNLQYLELIFENQIDIKDNFFFNLRQIQQLKEIHVEFIDESQQFIFTDKILVSIGYLANAQKNLQGIVLNVKSEDSITDQGIQQFIVLIQNHKNNLLNFQFSCQNTQITSSGVQQIIFYLQDCSYLQTFKIDLRQNQNISKYNFANLLQSLINKPNLNSISINFSMSQQLLEDQNDDNYAQKVLQNIKQYQQLTQFDLQLYSMSKQELLLILIFLQNTNINNIKIISKTYSDTKLSLNITAIRDLKYKQGIQKFHLEIQKKQQIYDENFCTFIINPLMKQTLLKSYIQEIGCDISQNQFDQYSTIIQNLKSEKNISIKRYQYPNITDEQLDQIFQEEDNYQIKAIALDLKEQIYLNETVLINIHQKLNQTISQYKLVIPKSMQLQNLSLRNISHFIAIQYDLKSIQLEFPDFDYNLTSIQLLFHCISISANPQYSYVEIILPCQISYQDIFYLSGYFQHISSFYLQFSKCQIDLDNQLLSDLNKSYNADETLYQNNQLTIKKSYNKFDASYENS